MPSEGRACRGGRDEGTEERARERESQKDGAGKTERRKRAETRPEAEGGRERQKLREAHSEKHTQRGEHRDSEPEVFSQPSSSIQMVLMPRYHFFPI